MEWANGITRRKIYRKKKKRDLRLRSSQVAVALKYTRFPSFVTVLLSDVSHFGLRCQGIQFIEGLRDAWSHDYPSIHSHP